MAMTIPQSWSDCGMDWNNPNPGDSSYALALKEAICERAAVIGINLPTVGNSRRQVCIFTGFIEAPYIRLHQMGQNINQYSRSVFRGCRI